MDRAETAPAGDAAPAGTSGRQSDDQQRRLEQRERQVAERKRDADERERIAQLRQRGVELRTRTAAAAARLASTEEYAARVYDGLAAREPGNPPHQRQADEAREAARRARETERKYSSS